MVEVYPGMVDEARRSILIEPKKGKKGVQEEDRKKERKQNEKKQNRRTR